MNEQVEQATARILLDRGIGFQIPAPFFLRWFGKKTVGISVKPLRLGTLLKIQVPQGALETASSKAGSDEGEFEQRKKAVEQLSGSEAVWLKYNHIAENSKKVSKTIACGLLNSSLRIRLFSGLLGRHLHRQCTADQLQELSMWLFAYGRAESFTNTTKLLGMMQVTMTRNLGQSEEVS